MNEQISIQSAVALADYRYPAIKWHAERIDVESFSLEGKANGLMHTVMIVGPDQIRNKIHDGADRVASRVLPS